MKLSAVTAALFVVAVASGTSAAYAQTSPGIQPPVVQPDAHGKKAKNDMGGTEDEQNACYHDAAKYCSDAIPDTFKVLACLKEHRKRLTKPCQQVLNDNGQ
jgi:hypothetical protein